MSATRCLVTGGSRGIGAAIAGALAERGAVVAVHAGRDRAAAEAVAAALPGTGHVAVVGDLTDPAAAEHVVAAAIEGLSGLDVLVNNAGVFEAHPIDGVDLATWRAAWRRHVDVNLLGPADLAWLHLDHLLERPEGPAGGRMVAVGSRGAYRGEPVTAAYAATKAALHAMTQSLALALAPHGVVATAIAPGFVETDMAREVLDGPAGDAVRAQSPFGRVATPDEVAATVAWLALEAPSWVSGAVLDVNGASYLR
ncbi:MAG TPA: SDR family oxidoreductase [Amnibacterium sp.]|uniref:SDR family NAD(P)-dependent oxidoreductase n=1 Tax=Amnibacterium sp. TaxID=1872496 RepID=UPI002F95DE4D